MADDIGRQHAGHRTDVRVRRWIGLIAYRHLSVGTLALSYPTAFGRAFAPMRTVAPLRAWGAALVIAGTLAACAVADRRWRPVAVSVSSFLTACWVVQFGVAAARGEPSSIVWALTYSTLLLKDWTIATLPLNRSG